VSRGEFFALALISSLKKKEMNIIGKGCQICVDRGRINCEKERQGVPNNERDRKDCIYFEEALEEESSKRDKLCG